jgi:hypothetical protein
MDVSSLGNYTAASRFAADGAIDETLRNEISKDDPLVPRFWLYLMGREVWSCLPYRPMRWTRMATLFRNSIRKPVSMSI